MYHSTVFPGAPETCGDGVDQDCNGSDCAANVCPTIRVTRSSITVAQGEPVLISWDGTDPDDAAVIALYADTDTEPANGIAYTVTTNRAEDGSYNWDTSGVAGGSYYIRGVIDDSQCTGDQYAS